MTHEELVTQVATLQAALSAQQLGQNSQGTSRTPVLGPLSNLLQPPPSATVPKPNFFYEGMHLPNVAGKPFPTLRFRLTETGVEEKVCRNVAEVVALGDDWSPVPPSVELPSPLESLEDAMASLTEDEKRFVMEQQKSVRLEAIKAQLASLSHDDLAAIGSGVTAKRKPGRPKKVE